MFHSYAHSRAFVAREEKATCGPDIVRHPPLVDSVVSNRHERYAQIRARREFPALEHSVDPIADDQPGRSIYPCQRIMR